MPQVVLIFVREYMSCVLITLYKNFPWVTQCTRFISYQGVSICLSSKFSKLLTKFLLDQWFNVTRNQERVSNNHGNFWNLKQLTKGLELYVITLVKLCLPKRVPPGKVYTRICTQYCALGFSQKQVCFFSGMDYIL